MTHFFKVKFINYNLGLLFGISPMSLPQCVSFFQINSELTFFKYILTLHNNHFLKNSNLIEKTHIAVTIFLREDHPLELLHYRIRQMIAQLTPLDE